MLNGVAIAVVFFILGAITGFIIRSVITQKSFNFDTDDRINWLIVVVTLIWVTSVLVDILSATYETSPLIHGIMGAIVGFVFWKPKYNEK